MVKTLREIKPSRSMRRSVCVRTLEETSGSARCSWPERKGAGLEQMQDRNSPFVEKQFDGVAGLQDPGPHGLFGHTYLQVCTYLEVPRSLERNTATK